MVSKVVKIRKSSDCIPCKTRLSESEGVALLKGKSVLITSGHRLTGGKLRKDQELVELYLPRMDVESCKKQGNEWVVKVKFADEDEAVKYINAEDSDIKGGSFFRKLWRGMKKAGKFAWKVAKKVAPDIIKAVQPTVGQLFDQVANIPGVKSVYDASKTIASKIPGVGDAIDKAEGVVKSDVLGRGQYVGGVGQKLGGAMGKRMQMKAEERATAVCEMLHPLLVQHFMEGGRLVAV